MRRIFIILVCIWAHLACTQSDMNVGGSGDSDADTDSDADADADADTDTDSDTDTDADSDTDSDTGSDAVECTEITVEEDCGEDGYCVDGYCCDTLCDGDCDGCDLPGNAGICTFYDSATVCRPAEGICDAPESCTGSSAVCPDDELLGTSDICRPAVDDCDVDEMCDGLTADGCPSVDVKADVGDPCGDDSTTECTSPDSCDGAGTCLDSHQDGATVCGGVLTEYQCSSSDCAATPQSRTLDQHCDPDAGTCDGDTTVVVDWADIDVACSDTEICVSDGVADATCVICDTPGPGYCVGDVAHFYPPGIGTCVLGECSYVESTETCIEPELCLWGTCTEAIATTPWQKAIEFDGSNDRLKQVNNSDLLNPLRRATNGDGRAWSVATVFKGTTTGSQYLWSQSADSSSDSAEVSLRINGATLTFEYGTTWNALQWNAAGATPLDAWHAIAVTFDGGTTGVASDAMDTYYGRFHIWQVDTITGIATDITGSGVWSNQNYGYTGAFTGDYYVGARWASSSGGLVGFIAGNAVTDQAITSAAEIADFCVDPFKWASDNGLTSEVDGQTNKVWLMGDGATDAFDIVTNQIYPAGTDGDLLMGGDMTAGDIVDVSIPDLTF